MDIIYKNIKEIEETNVVIDPEKNIAISFICLKDDWKELKKDINSLKDLINWIRILEDLTIQQFLDKWRTKWGFSKEKENQPNHKKFNKRTKKFKEHKQKIVEIECYENKNYGHCHINSWKSKKLIRLFWILNKAKAKFCMVHIDWEGKENH